MKKSAVYQAAHEDTCEADIAQALRIVSNVLSLEMFRTTEFMRSNNHCDSTLAELCMENIKIAEILDTKAKTILDSIFNE